MASLLSFSVIIVSSDAWLFVGNARQQTPRLTSENGANTVFLLGTISGSRSSDSARWTGNKWEKYIQPDNESILC